MNLGSIEACRWYSTTWDAVQVGSKTHRRRRSISGIVVYGTVSEKLRTGYHALRYNGYICSMSEWKLGNLSKGIRRIYQYCRKKDGTTRTISQEGSYHRVTTDTKLSWKKSCCCILYHQNTKEDGNNRAGELRQRLVWQFGDTSVSEPCDIDRKDVLTKRTMERPTSKII